MKKTVLITGATGGIGQALCLRYAQKGYNVALQFFSGEAKAAELCERVQRFGVTAKAYRADFSKENEVTALAQRVLADFAKVDVLVNNAGVAYMQVFQLADSKKVGELFDINLMSAMSLTKEILPSMIKNQSGRIINISSMWGICGASCEVHYSASKSALIGFTKALAKEVGPSGITVNCIAPGFIDTPMNATLDEAAVKEIVECTPVGRAGRGEDVACLASFLSSDEAEFITGQVISVDGGYAV